MKELTTIEYAISVRLKRWKCSHCGYIVEPITDTNVEQAFASHCSGDLAQLVSEAAPMIELLPCKCDTASHGGYECPRCQWLRERWILDMGLETPFKAPHNPAIEILGVKPT